jgi:hypothetical protein
MAELGLAEFQVPVILVGAVVVIAMATLLLHLLFPIAKAPSEGAALAWQSGRCPACQQNLDQMERHGIRIQICPQCQSVWTTKAAK